MYKIKFISNFNPELNNEKEEFSKEIKEKEEALYMYQELFNLSKNMILEHLNAVAAYQNDSATNEVINAIIASVNKISSDDYIDMKGNNGSFLIVDDNHLVYDCFGKSLTLSLETN